MLVFLKKYLSQKPTLITLYSILVLAATIQALLPRPKIYHEGGRVYNQYNNYTIFERSFHHLNDQQDLYQLYPEEHWDLYKYTPTFSAFFGIFASCPDWLGLLLWNSLNAFLLLAAIYALPYLSSLHKGGISLFVAIEMMTSIQSEQSNALIAALLLFTLIFLERKKVIWACFCVVAASFIKLFGLVGFALFLLYPNKFKAATWTIIWTILFAALPLCWISLEHYTFLLESYGNLLTQDHSASYGYSVMGILHSWFGYMGSKFLVVGIGILLFLLPFLRIKQYSNWSFRMLALASVLIWIIIFNHKAESPTFIIAMMGIILWYAQSEQAWVHKALLILAFVLTSLSPTDIFPAAIRAAWIHPYALKALPCVLVWLVILYEMLVTDFPKERAISKELSNS